MSNENLYCSCLFSKSTTWLPTSIKSEDEASVQNKLEDRNSKQRMPNYRMYPEQIVWLFLKIS